MSISFFYNKIYIKNLIKKGCRPVDVESEKLLNSKGIKFEYKDYNEIVKKEESPKVQKMMNKPSTNELSQLNRFKACRNCSASEVEIKDGIYVCVYCGCSLGSV